MELQWERTFKFMGGLDGTKENENEPHSQEATPFFASCQFDCDLSFAGLLQLLETTCTSLWITSYDNQLATSLLVNILPHNASWHRLVDNKSVETCAFRLCMPVKTIGS